MKNFITLALTLALICGPVLAQSSRNCNTREVAVEYLSGEEFGEGVYAIGSLEDNSAIVEFWGSEATGTWTITMTNPRGVTCIIASGQSFETQTPVIIEGEPT